MNEPLRSVSDAAEAARARRARRCRRRRSRSTTSRRRTASTSTGDGGPGCSTCSAGPAHRTASSRRCATSPSTSRRARARRDRPQRRGQVDAAANDLRRAPTGGGPHHGARPHLRTSRWASASTKASPAGRTSGSAGSRSGSTRIGCARSPTTIADFAQLGEYLDFPVSAYSSGMRMRLAFAVAAHLDPEVLLIDEALAGGDTKFVAADRLEVERAVRRGPHDRARHPRAEHHPHDGDIQRSGCTKVAIVEQRRSRRGRREVHALLPARGEQISSGTRTERTPARFGVRSTQIDPSASSTYLQEVSEGRA